MSSHAKGKECSTCRPGIADYIRAHLDAQQRRANGEKQTQCPECGRWCWPHQFVQVREEEKRPS